MQYRREIDGLRAVAVIPVILFHAGFSWIEGGFVGVDIFFVISGYLITSLILNELRVGTFTIASFYERRIRRILPAMMFVVLICLPFAWRWMLPSEMTDFSASVGAVAAFVSNILFMKTAGYFEMDAGVRPLLHTWSLAVEEQYYIVFPLALLLFWRFRKSWIAPALAIILVISLLAAQIGANFHISRPYIGAPWVWWNPGADWFYFTPARVWELLLGALIGIGLSGRADLISTTTSRTVSEILAIAGLAMIAIAIVRFDKNTPSPSVYILVPTVGTALLILFATPQTATGKLLGHRWLVGMGLISYSAYLWHQPLFAFARMRLLNPPGPWTFAVLSVASIALAYLTWRYIEQPFRDRTRFERKTILVSAAVVSTAMITVGAAGYYGNGLPWRLDPKVLAFAKIADERGFGTCAVDKLDFRNECVHGDADNVRIAFVGDSHAGALVGEFSRFAEARHLGIKRLTLPGCPPARGLYRVDLQSTAFNCDGDYGKVLAYLHNNPAIDTVLMMAWWSQFLERTYFDNGEGVRDFGREPFVEALGVSYSKSDEVGRIKRVQKAYTDGVRELLAMGKTVVVVYPVPEVGWNVPLTLAKAAIFGTSKSNLSTSYQRFKERSARTYEALDAAGPHPRLIPIKPEVLFCNTALPGRCITEVDGAPLYYDHHHISNAGARLLSDEIMRRLYGH